MVEGEDVLARRYSGDSIVKNGFVRVKRRRRRAAARECDFIEGDGRPNPRLPAKKALAVA